MKRFKVEQVVLCEVRVWGYVHADNMNDAAAKFLETDTGDSNYDHEIISDLKTISVEVKEEV
jgi:hypothetical protein